MNYHGPRRQALTRDLKRDSLDALLISDPVNIYYLTGFTGDSAYFIATGKQSILVSDTRFEAQIAEECPGLEAVIRSHDRTTVEALGEVLTQAAFRAVGVESGHVTLAVLEALKQHAPKCTFTGAGARVEELRAVKDPSEVEHIRAAVRVAEQAFRMFRVMIRENDSEKELADRMDHYIRRAGGQRSSFPVIAAIGTRGALPHAPPTKLQMDAGSKLLVDWGAVLHGYHADLTRTFRNPYATAPTRKNKAERTGRSLEKIHAIVLKAQAAAVAVVRAGITGGEVDTAARKVIDDAGYGEFFTHSVGHGLGLQVHEAPRLRVNSLDLLQEGMVVTVEPGIYIPGWGGVRIEDDILVRRDGCTVLSTLPRGLDDVESEAM